MGTTTYSISEAKSHLNRILRNLGRGDEVIITRRGRPYGRLTPVDRKVDAKPSLATLRGALSELPDADYQDFRNVRTAAGRWRPR